MLVRVLPSIGIKATLLSGVNNMAVTVTYTEGKGRRNFFPSELKHNTSVKRWAKFGKPKVSMPLWKSFDRKTIRPLFEELVKDRVSKEDMDYYFNEAYDAINRAWKYDIMHDEQARRMANHVDHMKKIEKYMKDRNIPYRK